MHLRDLWRGHFEIVRRSHRWVGDEAAVYQRVFDDSPPGPRRFAGPETDRVAELTVRPV